MMKIRDLAFLVIGGLLVISGMVLNSVLVTDAEAQDGDNTYLKNVFCENLVITDKNGKTKGLFGLAGGDATFAIYGDDGGGPVAYLGRNKKGDDEMSATNGTNGNHTRNTWRKCHSNGKRYSVLFTVRIMFPNLTASNSALIRGVPGPLSSRTPLVQLLRQRLL